MIQQFQDSYFESCYQATVWGYNSPDFTKVTLAYGINPFSINKPKEIETRLAKLWKDLTQPFLLEILMDIHTNVFPKIIFGSTLTKMGINVVTTLISSGLNSPKLAANDT